jgi:hypothetical protein
MTLIETPLQVIQELSAIRSESERGIKLLFDAEKKYVQLDLAADKAEARFFLDAQGTVSDRQAVAKIQSEAERLAAEIAKAEVSYIKTKLKHLSESMMAVQTSARMVELQWKTSGVGER